MDKSINMYRITIKGEAHTTYPYLEKLDGIDCQDEFSEYFHGKFRDDENEQSLIDKGVHSGYMDFRFENGKLWTYTDYQSPVELTKEELDILAEYTQGQWSDGIGEGFEQHPCDYNDPNWKNPDYEEEDEKYNSGEVYISPWYFGQKLIVTQDFINE